MDKVKASKKINAVFLATVLIAGTFALISPSFMTGAVQAEPGYEKKYGYDKPYEKPKYPSYKPDYNYKSKDSSISIKKIKCNNVNLNVNDLSVNVGRPQTGDFTSSLDTSSSETGNQGEITANSFAGNGERFNNNNNGFKKDKDGFVYVCVNNNNNVVVGGEEPDLACEECFGANSRLQTAILDFLVEFDGIALSTFFRADGISEGLIIGSETDTIEQLCAQIENAVEELGVPLSDALLEGFFSFILGEDFETEIDTLIECLLEAGLIIHVEFPSDSISANGIASPNVECTGDSLCTKLEQ